MIRQTIVFLVLFFFSGITIFAQTSTKPIVIEPTNFDTSIPLRDMKEVSSTPTNWTDGIIPLNRTKPETKEHYKKDEALQTFNGIGGLATIGVNFDGVSASGYAPPDVTMDVGPNHIMQMVNVEFQIWDKSGNSLLGPLSLGTIWSGFPGPWASSINDGDPVVLYDESADRWFASQFSLPNGGSGPEYLLVAISQTSDPTGSWHRYGFETPDFPDYPHWGVWPDGYYFSANRFSGGFAGTYAGAVERDKMLTGASAQLILFSLSAATTASLLPSDWDGATTPPSGAPNPFVMAHDDASFVGSDGLDVYELHADWLTPSNSTFNGPSFISVSPFSTVNNIPQLGTGTTLDDLSDRLMQRLQYRNFGTHQTMVVCQTIDAGGSRAGMRWYEMRKTGANWSLYQQGTYAPNDGLERWMGSIAMNDNGDIALGYSVSSASIHPEIRYTGRFNGDALGVMTIAEDLIFAGNGSQTSGLSRWGDYTQMAVDPTDGQTFWYSCEYIPSNGSFNWNTRIASFSFGPPCTVNLPTNPNPSDGVSNIPVSTSQISWTNGSGATLCEVWFGESGNMTLRYNGALINSWNIPAQLNYNTTYNWKIVDKDGTCGVSGPTWSFHTEQSPAVIFTEAFTNLSCWTAIGPLGTSNWSTANSINAGGISPELELSWTPQFDGLSKFVSCPIQVENNRNYSVELKHMMDWFANPAPTVGIGVSYDNGTTYTPIWSLQPTGNVGPEIITASFTTPAAASPDVVNLSLVLFCNGNSFNINFWYVDDITLTDDDFSIVSDPAFFAATAISDTSILLGFTTNVNNDNILIAWNLTGIFTAPSGAPPAPGQPFAGGSLLFNGTVSPVNHSGLNNLTTYYYRAFSYDNTNYSPGLDANATTLDPPAVTDFSVDFLVSDNCSNSISLLFGTAPGATECYDEGLDQWAPPPPPSGVFDGRFVSCNDGLFIDYKATNPDSTRIWNVMYQPTTGCEPVSFSWDPALLPVDGNFNLVDPFTGNMVNVDMRTSNNYTDALGLGQLQIIYSFGAPTFSLSVSVLDGWNMVSIPGLHPTDQDVLTWWSGKDPAAAVFGFNGSYSAVTTAAPGEGYWMKHLGANLYDTGDEWPVGGIQLVIHDPIPANAGWNLIGGYENIATTSLLTSTPPGLITGPIFGFSGGYSAVSSLDPGLAYWIKLTAAGDIIIPPTVLSKAGAEPVEYFKEEWGRIIITDKAGRNFVLYAVTDDVNLDNYEMPPAPPEGSFDIRFSSNRIAEDINAAIQTIQMSSGVEYPIIVRVENMDIRIQDESGRVLNEVIESGQQITINSQLSKLVVTGELVPEVYALEQNYPNPFNPSTVIEFSLPEDAGNVMLTIYDVLGQTVTQLLNAPLKAGKYSYQWDAGSVTSGMYIYELRTNKFVSIKKMVLLK